jgi:hypothetical protein
LKTWQNATKDFNTIVKIRKVVAEYKLMEMEKTPYLHFRIKIWENDDGSFEGYTNLQIRDIGDKQNESYYCAAGKGDTEIDALYSVLERFYEHLSQKEEWTETDFKCIDEYDF